MKYQQKLALKQMQKSYVAPELDPIEARGYVDMVECDENTSAGADSLLNAAVFKLKCSI